MDVLRINADCFSRSLKNLDDDEGITREELATVLSNALLSATAVLQSTLTQEEDKSEDTFEKVEDTVKRIVLHQTLSR